MQLFNRLARSRLERMDRLISSINVRSMFELFKCCDGGRDVAEELKQWYKTSQL